MSGHVSVSRQVAKGMSRSPEGPGGLRPILRTVEDARNFNRVRGDPINGKVGQWRERQFSPPGHPAESATVGEFLQTGAPVIDRSRNSPGRIWIVALYSFADTLQVFRCRQRPTNCQGWRNR